MRSEYDKFFLTKEMSVYEAAQVIDNNTKKTAFLVDGNVLVGALTDGDLRRFLINKGNVDDPVTKIINYSPLFLYENENNSAEDYTNYMISHAITALPIVDYQKRIKKIVFLNNRKKVDNKIPCDVSVVIMAGGKGSRLKPYTDIIPKPLIPIGEKTITEHIIEHYAAFGCNQFNLIVNYKKNLIETYFKETPVNANLTFIEESKFQGTAGGLVLLPADTSENFFLTNCDILVDANYYAIYNTHIERENLVTIITAKQDMMVPYGVIQLDDSDKVISLTEKPIQHYNINTGMYVCNKKILQYIHETECIDMPDLIQRCMGSGERVGIYSIMSDEWSDMGQSEELAKMKKYMHLI